MKLKNQIGLAKQKYFSTNIPPELSYVVNKSILSANPKRSVLFSLFKYTTYIAACACICFVLLINTMPVFAMSIYDIPVIGTVARVFTFREYKFEDENKVIEVKYPSIKNTGNTPLEQRINYEILSKIDSIIEDAKIRADEYKKAFVETGGNPKDFLPVIIIIDYEIKRQDDKIVSFVIDKFENHVSAYNEQYFYNIDIETGKEITLKNMLGENYIELANEQIKKQIAERKKEDPENMLYFDDIGAFTSIHPDQNFYIKENGNVVIVFEKYEIAPGYMGIQEFEIIK